MRATTRRPRGDRPLRARVNALFCAGKVSASWQVEGVLFPGRIIQLPGGQLYAGRSGKQIGDRRGAAAAAVAAAAAAARNGRRGGSKADRTKSPVNALFRANGSVRESRFSLATWRARRAQVRPRAIPVLPSPHARVRQVDHHLWIIFGISISTAINVLQSLRGERGNFVRSLDFLDKIGDVDN